MSVTAQLAGVSPCKTGALQAVDRGAGGYFFGRAAAGVEHRRAFLARAVVPCISFIGVGGAARSWRIAFSKASFSTFISVQWCLKTKSPAEAGALRCGRETSPS